MKYLSFSCLGNRGRLGNQMFQIASTVGLAKKHNLMPTFPVWSYAPYFKNKLPNNCPAEEVFRTIRERHFHYHEWELSEKTPYSIDLDGYLQSEKYFDGVPFEWSDNFLSRIRIKYAFMSELKETLCVQVRRGDFVGHKNYYQLPVTYFIKAISSFENWSDMTIVFITDDIHWCQLEFGCLHNAVFPSGSDIEHMCLGSLCDNFVLSNSTFAWWIARLAEERKAVRVVHPGHLFAGDFAANATKDYWPDRWVRFQEDNYKLDLTDITFTIPVFYAERDQKQNLELSVCTLQSYCDTNIIIGEQGGKVFKYMAKRGKYVNFSINQFDSTSIFKEMALQADTPYIANWDCDVVVPAMQLLLTALKLRGGADIVYLHAGNFISVSRESFNRLEGTFDIEMVVQAQEVVKKKAENSVGGAVFLNKQSFINANEQKKRLYYAVHPQLYKIKIEGTGKLDTNYERMINEPVSVLYAVKILVKAFINILGLGQRRNLIKR